MSRSHDRGGQDIPLPSQGKEGEDIRLLTHVATRELDPADDGVFH